MNKLRDDVQGGPDTSGKPNNEIFLQDSLAEILAAAGELGTRIGNDKITALRHLAAAFILRTTVNGRLLSYLELGRFSIPGENLLQAFRGHIEKDVKDNSAEAVETWRRAVELLNNALRGRQMRFTRDASEREGCLDVDRYAEVLATLMRQAGEKEFNLAIYGHWGRGKTFLMKRTAEELQKPPPKDSLKFQTVTFSAWQYPSRPEVWIHLYETFARAAFDNGTWKSLPNIVRTGAARHGYWKLLAALLLGIIALIPLPTRVTLAAQFLWAYYSAVGIAGVLLTYTFYSGVTGTCKRMKAHYLSATRHSEKLGLQATIGDDLAALLKGWVPGTGMGGWFYAGFAAIPLFAAGTLGWRVHHSWNNQPAWVAAVPAAILFVVAIVICRWLFPWKPEPEKILLTVDDLDRCDPTHLLSVMETIKLLLENPEISRRVLVSMLIEEDILRHAIWQKYAHLAGKEAGKALGTNFNGERIARENCEKLFTVHLRLPPLDPREIRAVIGSFAPAGETEQRKPEEQQSTRTPQSANRQDAPTDAKASVKAARLYLDVNQGTDATNQLAYNEIILGHEERNALEEELSRQREATNQIAPLGPRAIRAFIFRYQLARLILAKLQITDWQPRILIAALAESLFDQPETPLMLQLQPEVAAVVRQVT